MINGGIFSYAVQSYCAIIPNHNNRASCNRNGQKNRNLDPEKNRKKIGIIKTTGEK